MNERLELIIKKFKDKYKTYGKFDCNDVYKYLKEKGEI